MAIKNIIAQGVGFSPGSTKYIPTLGFDLGAAPTIPKTAIALCVDDLTLYKYISFKGNTIILKRIK